MNKLQYINKAIKFHKKMLDDYLRIDFEAKVVEEIKRDLEILQQIKNELEAWEVVKPNIKYEEAENNEGIYMQYFLFLEVEEWKPEAFKIKKALEVKNDK